MLCSAADRSIISPQEIYPILPIKSGRKKEDETPLITYGSLVLETHSSLHCDKPSAVTGIVLGECIPEPPRSRQFKGSTRYTSCYEENETIVYTTESFKDRNCTKLRKATGEADVSIVGSRCTGMYKRRCSPIALGWREYRFNSHGQ
jgi:hypothetical protein